MAHRLRGLLVVGMIVLAACNGEDGDGRTATTPRLNTTSTAQATATTSPQARAEHAETLRRTYIGRKYTLAGAVPNVSVVFERPAPPSVELIEVGTGAGTSLDEVTNGTDRIMFFGVIEQSGSRESVPTTIVDVVIVAGEVWLSCDDGGGDDGRLFATLAPGTGRFRQASEAWRADMSRRRIIPINAEPVRCDIGGESGNLRGGDR